MESVFHDRDAQDRSGRQVWGYSLMIRHFLLKASENRWLRRRARSSGLLRRSVQRFMPGESLEDALTACQTLAVSKIPTVLTHLGESVSTQEEAVSVAKHYIEVLGAIESRKLPVEISVKPTQLGLDLGFDFCLSNLQMILAYVPANRTLWIDMEQSSYVDRTLRLLNSARSTRSNVGVCVQAYLRRTESDVDALIAAGAAVRLVKGAYAEPSSLAFPDKGHVDESYLRLAKKLLGKEARWNGVRAALATHDRKLANRIIVWAAAEGIPQDELEFQMLYGIQAERQKELAARGHRCRVLVSYGSSWFPWYMRRLAERPANLFFVLRNLV
jgi:proline dehydrogenase